MLTEVNRVQSLLIKIFGKDSIKYGNICYTHQLNARAL
jgi:hypothetical protein